MSEKYLEKTEVEEAPAQDAAGRTLVAERAVLRAEEEDTRGAIVLIATVPGITVEADDSDGEGLARALATLAAMVPG